jgi:hypothetical protein
MCESALRDTFHGKQAPANQANAWEVVLAINEDVVLQKLTDI